MLLWLLLYMPFDLRDMHFFKKYIQVELHGWVMRMFNLSATVLIPLNIPLSSIIISFLIIAFKWVVISHDNFYIAFP